MASDNETNWKERYDKLNKEFTEYKFSNGMIKDDLSEYLCEMIGMTIKEKDEYGRIFLKLSRSDILFLITKFKQDYPNP